MSDEHDHSQHEHGRPAQNPAPGTPMFPEDAGSQALSEALKSSFAIVKVMMVLLVFVFLGNGIFQVGSSERAVILHFGRPEGEGNKALLGPGLHWSWPYPIDEVVKIPITEIQKVTSNVGWYFVTPEQEFNNIEPMAGPSLNPAQDGYTITSDGNIIHTRATLEYRIDDPIRFEFDFVNASNAVQNALDNALLYASASYKVDDILTKDKAGFQDLVMRRVTELARDEDLGIVVEQCHVESIPPRQVKQAFEAVLTALSERDKAHNDALSYENQVISRATAEAASRTNNAETERVRLVGAVQAEAQRFTDLLPNNQANPTLFVNMLLTEKIGQVLTNVQDKIYLPERGDGKSRELRLQLSREPEEPAGPQLGQ